MQWCPWLRQEVCQRHVSKDPLICFTVRLTSEAKVSMGARVPEVSTTHRAASLTPLKATAGFMDHRHSCTTQVEALLSSSPRLK